MELTDFWKVIRKRKSAILSAWLIFILLGLIFTFSQPLKYVAKSRLLIVQNSSSSDPYTISKSNQYLGALFSQVVYSESFFKLVMSSGFNVDKNYFGNSQRQQIETWKKTITAKNLGETGILEINIYQPNPQQAKQIALAVNNALITQGFNYQGNKNIQIKIIDQPLLSRFPVKPNIIFNLISFSILGLLGGLVYLYIFPTKKKKKIRTKKKNEINYYQVKNNDLQEGDTYYQAKDNNIKEDIEGNIHNIIGHFD